MIDRQLGGCVDSVFFLRVASASTRPLPACLQEYPFFSLSSFKNIQLLCIASPLLHYHSEPSGQVRKNERNQILKHYPTKFGIFVSSPSSSGFGSMARDLLLLFG